MSVIAKYLCLFRFQFDLNENVWEYANISKRYI